MYRFALLSCALLVVQGDPVDLMKKCGRFMHPEGMACCTKEYKFNGDKETMQECMQVPEKPPSCERAICTAKKMGVASDDGTIDKKALANLIKKEGDGDTELVEAIIETCVEGDLTDFGPPDFCDIIKMGHCLKMHLVVDCPEWKNDGTCSGAQEEAEECIKILLN